MNLRKPIPSAACLVAGLISLALATPAQAVEFRLAVGLSYVNGTYDTNDKLQETLVQQGNTVEDSLVIPVGLMLNPYVEFENGLGIGASVGPATFAVIERDGEFTGRRHRNDDIDYIVPIGAHVRYTFLRKTDISPYLRAGFHFPFVGGPQMDEGRVGAFGAIGAEFLRTKRVGFGVEASYDSSRVRFVGGRTARPNGFMLSAFAVF